MLPEDKTEDIPCAMRLTQDDNRLELVVTTEDNAPKEVYLSCLVITAIRYAKTNNMDIERCLKDLMSTVKFDEKEDLN